MPRPADNYTHAQFEDIASNTLSQTVRCIHCRNWQGSTATLHRKKDHLLKCSAYLAWRAEGNGQDLPPPNPYKKRHSTMTWDTDGQTDYDSESFQPARFSDRSAAATQLDARQFTPSQERGAKTKKMDLHKYFDELWDQSGGEQGVKVRCQACGYTRLKNINLQREHLRTCKEFLNTPEGALASANGELAVGEPIKGPGPSRDIYSGRISNPNLIARPRSTPFAGQRSGQKMSRSVSENVPLYITVRNKAPMPPMGRSKPQPSLVNHLCNKFSDRLAKATQSGFLSHAGAGTLSRDALVHWLSQNAHITRNLITLVGSLISKIELEDLGTPQNSTQHRALDLLVSAVSNLHKEFEFMNTTKQKYRLFSQPEMPTPITKAILDLLNSCASAYTSLLEGMVVLWAIELCYCASFQYASNFATTVQPNNTAYSFPAYLSASQPSNAFVTAGSSSPPAHTHAIQQALIPNWSSREFGQFVDACKAIVDELANAQTTGSGAEELVRCESQHEQVLYLWERMWPEVDGMGEEAEISNSNGSAGMDTVPSSAVLPQQQQQKDDLNNVGNANDSVVNKSGLIGVDDDDVGPGETSTLDSPYGGTGLGAVARNNETS